MTILWDWNGTLLSDVALGVECEMEALRHFGFRPFSAEEYLRLFRFPVSSFYALHGVTQEAYPAVAQRWSENYTKGFPKTELRADTLDCLSRLRESGVQQFILSATREDLLLEQVRHFPSLPPLLDGVYGIGNIYAAGKVARALENMDALGLKRQDTILIGDTLHDAEVAGEAGIRCLLVEGGHQAREVLDTAGLPVFASLTHAMDHLLQEVLEVRS